MTTTNAPALEGQVLFFKRPEPLHPNTHAKLGIKTTPYPFAFMKDANVVPVMASEFAQAAAHYPLIFTNDGKGMLAVMGVRQGENLFMDANGTPDPDVYLPAFARRYPFVFAANPQGNDFLVCVDRDAPMVGENPDVAFFDEKGEATEFTKNAIEFLGDFERQRRTTEAFCEIVREAGLLETKQVTWQPQNPDGTLAEPQLVAEYQGVSEDKLKALPDAKLIELSKNGAIGAIYAHMVSLMQWNKLVNMTIRRAMVDQQPEVDLNFSRAN
jgi:hypothetical protein